MEWPTVTQVLGWAMPRDGYLDPYYLRRGTYVHAACAILARGQELDPDHPSYALGLEEHPMPLSKNGGTERWCDYVDTYRAWLLLLKEKWPDPVVVASEQEIRNETEMYIGHPDQIWRVADGTEVVIDLKTGSAPKSTALQTCAYDLGLPHEKRRRRYALELKPGHARLIEYTDSRDYAAFRLLVRAYWIVNGGAYK